MNSPAAPCRNCDTRSARCHGSCEKYKAYKDEVAAYKATIKTYNAEHDTYPWDKYIRGKPVDVYCATHKKGGKKRYG